jgi:hypothetical protein
MAYCALTRSELDNTLPSLLATCVCASERCGLKPTWLALAALIHSCAPERDTTFAARGAHPVRGKGRAHPLMFR